MKRISEMIFFAALPIVFFLVGCSNGSDDSSQLAVDSVITKPIPGVLPIVGVAENTVCSVGSDLSNVTKKALKNTGYSTSESPRMIPEVFVIKASEAGKMTDSQKSLLMETLIADKTVIIDRPKAENLNELADCIKLSLPKYEDLMMRYKIDDNSFDHMLRQLEKIGSTGNQIYEAIGVRDCHLYLVHDVDDGIVLAETKDSDVKTQAVEGAENPKEMESEKDNDREDSAMDTESLEDSAARLLADWILNAGKNGFDNPDPTRAIEQTDTRSAGVNIDELKKAQTVRQSFTAKFYRNPKEKYYDGRYNNRSETIEVATYVWTACDIEKKLDYYLIEESITCFNQNLKYSQNWKHHYLGPWLGNLTVTTRIDESQTVLFEKCSPQTSTGSSSFTTGSSFNIGGNAGVSMTGPNAGISGGVTFSESSTRSIPDVSVVLSKTSLNEPCWSFTTKDGGCHWDGLYTKGDDPCMIAYKQMTVDTYSLMTLPSNSACYDNEHFTLICWVNVNLAMLTGWLSGFCNSVLNSEIRYSSTQKILSNVFDRPSNAAANYIMGFSSPSEYSVAEKNVLAKNLKEKISDWKDSASYYAVGEGNLDKVANDYFMKVKTVIEANKNVLWDVGFKGRFKFYIQHATSGRRAGEFDVVFSERQLSQ